MALYGCFGRIGSGKSVKATELAIDLANQEHKNIITNYPINLDALWRYCIIKKFDNLIELINNPGFIKFYDLSKDANLKKSDITNCSLMFDNHSSVIIVDEAGIFLNSRNWQNTNLSILQRLCQSRKRSNHAFIISQSPEQIDKQLRDLLQFFLICSATTRRGNDGLVYMVLKNCKMFEQESYQKWKNSKNVFNPIKTRFAYVMKTWSGPVMSDEILLFNIYNSYDELDQGLSQDIPGYELIPSDNGGFYSSLPGNYPKFSELSKNQKIYYSILRFLLPKFPAPASEKIHKIAINFTRFSAQFATILKIKNLTSIIIALSMVILSIHIHPYFLAFAWGYFLYEIIKFTYARN